MAVSCEFFSAFSLPVLCYAPLPVEQEVGLDWTLSFGLGLRLWLGLPGVCHVGMPHKHAASSGMKCIIYLRDSQVICFLTKRTCENRKFWDDIKYLLAIYASCEARESNLLAESASLEPKNIVNLQNKQALKHERAFYLLLHNVICSPKQRNIVSQT